jgi:hypothetical protein
MLRIVKTRYKVLYVVVAILVAVIAVPNFWGQPWAWVSIVIGNAVFLSFFVVAIRCFRGREEPVEPKRAVWRFTARPTSGFVMAGVCLWFGAVYLMNLVQGLYLDSFQQLDKVINIVLASVLIFGYLNSSVRQVRARPLPLA